MIIRWLQPGVVLHAVFVTERGKKTFEMAKN